MKVAGVMSGTSLDGIDVALVDISERRTRLKIKPLAFLTVPYPAPVRAAILSVSNTMTHTAVISRLNVLLGELYADAIIKICEASGIPLAKVALCGVHGQTIYHEGEAAEFLGRRVASTMQIGEASVVAERTGLWTVSNFRERDMAAGGKGAPLVPYVDFLLFRSAKVARAALNIGGIANITVIPAAAGSWNVIAYDTGPGNIVIDALVAHYSDGKQLYDRDGQIARKGKVHQKLLDSMLEDPYFRFLPPKTAGREQFGQPFVAGLVATGIPPEDLIATATELTALTVANAILAEPGVREVIASGGGIHNKWLMRRLGDLLPGHDVKTSAEFGIDPDAKEAIVFAVLAYEFIQRRPGNLPSATGARHAVLLGKDSPPS
jgi:anhydro-N-acetylmuramic acid kinase